MHRILLFIILFISVGSYAQEDYQAQQRNLEARKNAILKEIREFQSLLNTNKKQERVAHREQPALFMAVTGMKLKISYDRRRPVQAKPIAARPTKARLAGSGTATWLKLRLSIPWRPLDPYVSAVRLKASV